jgi:hypothetical protein
MPVERYRHRPLHVRAIRFTNNTNEIIRFLDELGYGYAMLKDPRNSVKDEFLINTDRGDLRLTEGHWLVMPPKGHVLLYRPDVFEMMYEVDD